MSRSTLCRQKGRTPARSSTSSGRKAARVSRCPATCATRPFCRKLVADAVKGLGGLDILVMNAARQQTHASILDISDDQFDWTMKTNIYAPFWIIKAALPHLQPGAAIIGTTSEQAYDPSEDLHDYAQTKAATMNYVKSLAKQLASKGIHVNGVAPGPIWTPLQVSGGETMEKLAQFGGDTPLKRPGQPAKLAGCMCGLPKRMEAIPPATSSVPAAARASPDRGYQGSIAGSFKCRAIFSTSTIANEARTTKARSFSGSAEARTEAALFAGEYLRDNPELVREGNRLRVEVRDERDDLLFEVVISARDPHEREDPLPMRDRAARDDIQRHSSSGMNSPSSSELCRGPSG